MPFSTYLPEHMGSIALHPPGPFIAGSQAELTLTYTAGKFGIDDTGMVKISWRTTSDMSKPQFDKPAAANFTTVEASNGAKLEVGSTGSTSGPTQTRFSFASAVAFYAPAIRSPFALAIGGRARPAFACKQMSRSALS